MLRALGVTTAKRIPQLPAVPTIAEAVPDYELIGNTPAAFAGYARKDPALSARIIDQAGAKAK